MTKQRIYGRTKSGGPITDEMIERFVEEAERGYEPGNWMDGAGDRGDRHSGMQPKRWSPCDSNPTYAMRLLGEPRQRASLSRRSSEGRSASI